MRKMHTKEQRRDAIADLIRSHSPASQDELAEHLGSLGFAVTQATISRDLEQLGATKVRRNGRLTYALPAVRGATGSGLSNVLRGWARSVTAAGNLVVIRTGPGSAHLVGVAMDEAEISGLVGTICGDDTIFAATTGAAEAQMLADHLEALRSSEG